MNLQFLTGRKFANPGITLTALMIDHLQEF